MSEARRWAHWTEQLRQCGTNFEDHDGQPIVVEVASDRMVTALFCGYIDGLYVPVSQQRDSRNLRLASKSTVLKLLSFTVSFITGMTVCYVLRQEEIFKFSNLVRFSHSRFCVSCFRFLLCST